MERSLIDKGDNGVQPIPLSTYSCIPFHPTTAYVK
jgi:hypothetical protein